MRWCVRARAPKNKNLSQNPAGISHESVSFAQWVSGAHRAPDMPLTIAKVVGVDKNTVAAARINVGGDNGCHPLRTQVRQRQSR
jgi:hypothetical protein